MNERFKRALIEIATYNFTGMLVLFLSVFAGFVLKGFSEPILTGVFNVQSYLGSYLLYTPLILLGFLVGILFPIMNVTFIKKGEKPWTQDNPSWYRFLTVSWIWNPEQSFLGYLFKKQGETKQIKLLTNIARVVFISTILFSILGLLIIFKPQLAISGIPPQQFSEGADIIFTSAVPSFAENGALLFELFILGGLLSLFIARKVKNKQSREIVFWTSALILLPLICGGSWSLFHSIVYGNSEASLLSTFFFGYISTLLTLLTGIFIWFLMGHFFNNLGLKLVELSQNNESLKIIYGLIVFVVLVLYLWFEYKSARRKKKSAEQRLVE